MSEMHKISSAMKSVATSAPSTKESARRLLRKLLTKDAEGLYPWQRPFEHDSFPDRAWGPYRTFHDYLRNVDVSGECKPPGAWSQMTVEDFRDWFHKEPEIIDLIDRAMQREAGNPTGANQYGTFDNVQGSSDPAPTGNSKTATLRRLRKDFPKLHERVVAGEMSANAAAVEAGFRRPTVQITDVDPAAAAERICEKLGEEFARQLKEAL